MSGTSFWSTSESAPRRSVCLAFCCRRANVHSQGSPAVDDVSISLQRFLRHCEWKERNLTWHGSTVVDKDALGCGFNSEDMYREFTQSEQAVAGSLDERLMLLGGGSAPGRPTSASTDETKQQSKITLLICCSCDSGQQESQEQFHELLFSYFSGQFVSPATSIATELAFSRAQFMTVSMRILITSRANLVPIYPLPKGLMSLCVDLSVPDSATSQSLSDTDADEWSDSTESRVPEQHKSKLSQAFCLLIESGLVVFPRAVPQTCTARLLRMTTHVTAAMERALSKRTGDEQQRRGSIEQGTLRYSEVCSRGRYRWDMLLHDGMELVSGGDAADDSLLTQLATQSSWSPLVAMALGPHFTWQASVIVSRPGAPAGKWHADGGHSKWHFSGESTTTPYALCVFIPLVPLELPSRRCKCESADDNKTAEDEDATLESASSAEQDSENSVYHGRGCTWFWPGSHRYAECLHLGSAASRFAGLVIPGAPMEVGAALLYDYRIVHAGGPNDYCQTDAVSPSTSKAASTSSSTDVHASARARVLGERPILQITYCRKGYNDIEKNYGDEQLLYD